MSVYRTIGPLVSNSTFRIAMSIFSQAECLLEVQENVLDKFRDGIFATKPKKKKEVKDENESDGM